MLTLLKVGQGLNVSITAKPLWLMPSTISSASSFGLPEKPRATKVAPQAIASSSGLIGAVRRALRGRLGDEPDLARRRGLPLGQPVDVVVHDDVADVEVAARGVDEVAAADGEGIAVAAQRQHLQVRVGDLDARRDRHRPAVHAVEAVGRHEERQAAGAADARDHHDVLGSVALLAHRVVERVQDAEVAAARAPGRLLVALVVVELGSGLTRRRLSGMLMDSLDRLRRASRRVNGRPP